jgi:hypothetical protein
MYSVNRQARTKRCLESTRCSSKPAFWRPLIFTYFQRLHSAKKDRLFRLGVFPYRGHNLTSQHTTSQHTPKHCKSYHRNTPTSHLHPAYAYASSSQPQHDRQSGILQGHVYIQSNKLPRWPGFDGIVSESTRFSTPSQQTATLAGRATQIPSLHPQ